MHFFHSSSQHPIPPCVRALAPPCFQFQKRQNVLNHSTLLRVHCTCLLYWVQTLQKTMSATIFLYFACILPAIAFGVLNAHNTGHNLE